MVFVNREKTRVVGDKERAKNKTQSVLAEQEIIETAKLYAVMTVGEAGHRWGLHVNTIKRQIMRGNLIGRKSNNDWMVTTKSMFERYGQPDKDWADNE